MMLETGARIMKPRLTIPVSLVTDLIRLTAAALTLVAALLQS